jgi:hypothetical protein
MARREPQVRDFAHAPGCVAAIVMPGSRRRNGVFMPNTDTEMNAKNNSTRLATEINAMEPVNVRTPQRSHKPATSGLC